MAAHIAPKILILGNGEMSKAISLLLQEKATISIWQHQPLSTLKEAVDGVDIVFFCIPTSPHYEIVKTLSQYVQPEMIFVSIAKGLDESGRSVVDVFTQVLNKKCGFATIYGPMISEEICQRKPAFGQISGSSAHVNHILHALFRDSGLHTTISEDLAGSNWAVILKNVYAIAFGICDGLGMGDNVRGFLCVAALAELTEVLNTFEASTVTASSLAGLGDLITTATSDGSSHHELGVKLAAGRGVPLSGEGVHSINMIIKYEILELKSYPLLLAVSKILESQGDAAQIMSSYLKTSIDT